MSQEEAASLRPDPVTKTLELSLCLPHSAQGVSQAWVRAYF